MRKLWQRGLLALGGFILALGIAGIIGHYLSAPWDSTIQQNVRTVTGTLDLENPSIVLSLPLVIIGLVIVIVAWRALIAANRTAPAIPDAGTPAKPVSAIEKVWIYHDFENQSIGKDNTAQFAMMMQEFLNEHFPGAACEWFIYYDHTQQEKYQVGADSLANSALSVKSAFHIVDLADDPHAGTSQAVDKRIIADILKRMYDTTGPLSIIIITADVDYLPVAQLLYFYRHVENAVSVWGRNFPSGSNWIREFQRGNRQKYLVRYHRLLAPVSQPRRR